MMSALRKIFLVDLNEERNTEAEEAERRAEEQARLEMRLLKQKQDIIKLVLDLNQSIEKEKKHKALQKTLHNEAFDVQINLIAKDFQIEPKILEKVLNRIHLSRLREHLINSPELIDLINVVMNGAVNEKINRLKQNTVAEDNKLFDVFYMHLCEAATIGSEAVKIVRQFGGIPFLMPEFVDMQSQYDEALKATEAAYKELTSMDNDAKKKGDILDVAQENSPAVERREESSLSSSGLLSFSIYKNDNKTSGAKEEKTPPTQSKNDDQSPDASEDKTPSSPKLG